MRSPRAIVVHVLVGVDDLTVGIDEFFEVLDWVRDTKSRAWLFDLLGGFCGALEAPFVVSSGQARILLHLHAVVDCSGFPHVLAAVLEEVLRDAVGRRCSVLRSEDVRVSAEYVQRSAAAIAHYVAKVGTLKTWRLPPITLAALLHEREADKSKALAWLLDRPSLYRRVQAEVLAAFFDRRRLTFERRPAAV